MSKKLFTYIIIRLNQADFANEEITKLKNLLTSLEIDPEMTESDMIVMLPEEVIPMLETESFAQHAIRAHRVISDLLMTSMLCNINCKLQGATDEEIYKEEKT